MKYKRFVSLLLAPILLAGAVFAQKTIVINDPTVKVDPAKVVSPSSEDLIKRDVLPKARKYWAKTAACEEEYEAQGEAQGAFSKPNSNQKLVFYQFCQTGNGLGNNGLVLIENGKVIGSYVSEGGWALDIEPLPDINQNGLNEFLLYYSGGMHQGEGGTGVDVLEFSLANLKGLGWFQSEGFTEDDSWVYKVSVRPGKPPAFYREKYISNDDKFQKTGKIAPFKLGKTYSSFTVLK